MLQSSSPFSFYSSSHRKYYIFLHLFSFLFIGLNKRLQSLYNGYIRSPAQYKRGNRPPPGKHPPFPFIFIVSSFQANNLLPTPIVYSIPSYNQLRNNNFHLWDRNTKISSAEGLRGMLGRDIYNYVSFFSLENMKNSPLFQIDQHPIRAYIQQKLELYQSSFSLTTIAKQIVKRLPGDYE